MKYFFSLLVLFFSSFVFAQSFHIKKVEYNITSSGKSQIGKTKPYALEQAVPVDKYTTFENLELFENYIKDYNQQLQNTRNFETISVSWEIINELSTNESKEVTLIVDVKDSFHLLALPHLISYNSNDGWKPKLKAKDTNFMGSMNTMSGDFYAILPIASENTNYEVGAEIAFTIPFKLYIFDVNWINDYTFSYNFEEGAPEWDAMTGFNFSIPFKSLKLQFEFCQYAYRNFDYSEFGDDTYFKEEMKIFLPIKLLNTKKIGTIYYTPYSVVYYNWDKDSINILNTSLSSPTMTIGHTLHTNNVNWYGNYRAGFSIELINDFNFYFQRKDFVPYISLNLNLYNYFKFFESNYFNKLGITASFTGFTYINSSKNKYFYGTNIGNYLRGIRDDQLFNSTTIFPEEKSLTTNSAIVLNLDFPFHLFTTNFSSKFMKYFNCDVQFSPFIDIALTHNRVTDSYFSLKDGFYAGGIEMLCYPRKWSSFTIRGSIGIDLGRYLFPDLLNMEWRNDVSKYEISIGLGLHY